jgi:hypothetical protein
MEYESCATVRDDDGLTATGKSGGESGRAAENKSKCQNSPWGSNVSTGFAAIGLALHNHPKSNIHLFGYSWYGFYLKKGEPVHKFYKWRPTAKLINIWKRPIDCHISQQNWDLGPYWPRKEAIAIIMTSDRCFIHPIYCADC